jgi:hypothetical protein
MEFEEFETHLARVRTEREGKFLPAGFQLFDSRTASEADLQRAEEALEVRLPEKYKEFMRRHGAGQFLFLDLLPVTPPDEGGDDLVSVNRSQFTPSGFLAVAPVGTGDWWGFSITGGVCDDEVAFVDHEDGHVHVSHSDFLEFLTRKGLRVE